MRRACRAGFSPLTHPFKPSNRSWYPYIFNFAYVKIQHWTLLETKRLKQHQEAFYSCTCHLVDLPNQSANRGLDVEHLGMDSRFRRRLWRHKLLPHRKGGAVFATATAAAFIESSWTPKGERGVERGERMPCIKQGSQHWSGIVFGFKCC